MPRRKIEREKSRIHPTFYRPKEVKDFSDLNPDDLPSLDVNDLISEWGTVAGNFAINTQLPTPTYIEVISYTFHKSFTGEDVVDYIIEVPTDPLTSSFDIRVNIAS